MRDLKCRGHIHYYDPIALFQNSLLHWHPFIQYRTTLQRISVGLMQITLSLRRTSLPELLPFTISCRKIEEWATTLLCEKNGKELVKVDVFRTRFELILRMCAW